MTIQEQDGAQGLVLGGGGDISVLCEVGQEGANLCGAHLGRMAFIVEKDETSRPIYIGLFCALRIMLEA
jgi:hypothetical protein